MKQYFTKRRIILGVAIIFVALIGFLIYRSKNKPADVLTDKVVKSSIESNALATGQVNSTTDLNLAFKGTGIVEKVNVKVGQKVESGAVLAYLSQKDQSATITQARASVAQAQANLNKVLAGASGPDIDIAKSAVFAAETTLRNYQDIYQSTVSQQDVLVTNARNALNSNSLEARRGSIVSGEVTATLSGSYQGTETGQYKFNVEYIGSGFKVKYRGLEIGTSGNIERGIPVALGTKGLYVTFSTDGSFSGSPVWTVDIPNTQASTYITYYNAYQAALQTREQAVVSAQNSINSAQASLDQAVRALAQKQADARPEDVAVARAQLLSAQGQLQAASATLDSTIIRAPANGTITLVDVKAGEQAGPSKTAIVLQDVDNLHIEANISEANIAQIKVDQPVTLTFDALGSDREFAGKVQLIDPASTVVSGVVNYKITVALEKFEEVKPGMTANISILTNSKSDVLNIPLRAVINKDGKKYVRVVTDTKKKTFEERVVETGLEADGGVVEITSGLTEGQEIVTFVNKK